MDIIPPNAGKKSVFSSVKKYLKDQDLSIKGIDAGRPWGGYFVIDESSLSTFIELFFPDFDQNNFVKENTLSPKILLVEPGKRLSWQYHHRRSEIWSVADGKVGIILSDTDTQKPVQTYKKNSRIEIEQGKRHRLVGLDEWGMVAEVWKHSDPENPSDENDIVRLEDDFGR